MGINTVKSKLGEFKFYLLLTALLSSVGLGSYWYGNEHAVKQQRVINSLQTSVNQLNNENNTLTRQLNILSVELEVAKMANQDIESDLQQQLNNSNELKKQLSFYQQVLAPELDADGFAVYTMQLKPSNSEGFFEFVATLMQKQKSTRFIKGSLTFEVEGSIDGKLEIYQPFKGSDGLAPLSFSFRYFETVNQLFSLPDNFIPEKLHVKAALTTSKRRSASHSQTFPWKL